MSNITLGVCAVAGGFAAVLAWLTAWRRFPQGRPPPIDLNELARLERIKFVLIAVLAVVVVGLAFVVNNLNEDIHTLIHR